MQQQFNPQSQQPMMQPPSVITTKDYLYLNDMLAWNLLAMKKAHFAATSCTDTQIKQELDRCGQMHQQHYVKLLNHMNKHMQSQPMN